MIEKQRKVVSSEGEHQRARKSLSQEYIIKAGKGISFFDREIKRASESRSKPPASRFQDDRF